MARPARAHPTSPPTGHGCRPRCRPVGQSARIRRSRSTAIEAITSVPAASSRFEASCSRASTSELLGHGPAPHHECCVAQRATGGLPGRSWCPYLTVYSGHLFDYKGVRDTNSAVPQQFFPQAVAGSQPTTDAATRPGGILVAPQRSRDIVTCVKQYLDLLDLVLRDGVDKSDCTGTGTRNIFGHQMRVRPGRGLPGPSRPRSCTFARIIGELSGSSVATPTSAGSRSGASPSGTSGPTRTVTSAPSTAISGVRGRPPTVATSTRSPGSSSPFDATPTAAATSSRRGMSPTSSDMALPVPHHVSVLRPSRRRRAQASTARASPRHTRIASSHQRSADIFLGVPSTSRPRPAHDDRGPADRPD